VTSHVTATYKLSVYYYYLLLLHVRTSWVVLGKDSTRLGSSWDSVGRQEYIRDHVWWPIAPTQVPQVESSHVSCGSLEYVSQLQVLRHSHICCNICRLPFSCSGDSMWMHSVEREWLRV